MGKLKLILTADYEIFGNGQGCVKKCIVEPTNRILDICDKYGAKLTLFVDVCEYWAFKRAAVNGLLKEPNLPHILIEKQLIDVVKRGHDIQLHFHPQWLDAEYQDNRRKVNNEYWRLPNVSKHPTWSIDKLFKEGKNTLEEIIQPIKPEYSCNIFRAGSWCIQDEEEVLDAMRKNNFIIDSTVASGMSLNNQHTFYNFKSTPNQPSWKIHNKVTLASEHGSITEIPIFSLLVPWYYNFYFKILKLINNISFTPTGCINKNKKIYSSNHFSSLFKNHYRMFNFCDATTFQELKYFANFAIKKYMNIIVDQDVPVVVIGHPKTFGNDKDFERFLSWISKKEIFCFSKYFV